MKKLLLIALLSFIMIQCKKKSATPSTPQTTCETDSHFAGKYVGTNVWQHDTIEIEFNTMDNDCRPVYTIKRFAKPYNYVANTNNCDSLIYQDYQIVGDRITTSDCKIIDNQTSVMDISIITSNCNSNYINFKKVN